MWDNTKLKSYSCHNQAKRFRKISIDMTTCCFAGRHLVNAKDVFPGPLQRASYNCLNIVPHWSTCHSEVSFSQEILDSSSYFIYVIELIFLYKNSIQLSFLQGKLILKILIKISLPHPQFIKKVLMIKRLKLLII